MTDPIPGAGETTIIGLPAIQFPVTSSGDRPLTQEDLETITRLADNTALLKNGDEIMIGKFRLVYFTNSAIRGQ